VKVAASNSASGHAFLRSVFKTTPCSPVVFGSDLLRSGLSGTRGFAQSLNTWRTRDVDARAGRYTAGAQRELVALHDPSRVFVHVPVLSRPTSKPRRPATTAK
jgi:hypothetical protein